LIHNKIKNKKIKIARTLQLHKKSANSKENDNAFADIEELGSSEL